MSSLLPALVKYSLGDAIALVRYSSQRLQSDRREAPTDLAQNSAAQVGQYRLDASDNHPHTGHRRVVGQLHDRDTSSKPARVHWSKGYASK
jgi:hypothetical protein